MATHRELMAGRALPVLVAPMFLVSGPELVIASCRAGLVGSFPAANARSAEILAQWMGRIRDEVAGAPWALNLVVLPKYNPLLPQQMELLDEYRPPVVITSLGRPNAIVERVHAYGGLVWHDVTTIEHAEKALASGVDGLILVTSGAGGHCGPLHPFAFVPQVRRFWDGTLVLAGAISDGAAILAAQAIGADLVSMGTRFLATAESMAPDEYKDLVVTQESADIIVTDRVSGLPAAFLRGSLQRMGLDPDNLPPLRAPFQADLPEGVKAWRDAWSAGQGVGLIDDIPTVAELSERLQREYASARASLDAGWQR